jgi:hypothetical protein
VILRSLSVCAATAVAVIGTSGAPGQAAATNVVAHWKMNEPAGATTMVDSSGHNINGQIGSAVVTGVTYLGATGYHWNRVNPNEAPAKPERLVTANDSRLNPGTGDYAVTIRFRTTHSYGNMIQKGQAGSKGGYFKFQNVKGKVSCLFRGRDSSGNTVSKSVNSGTTLLNDGAWHTLRCERTADKVELWVDDNVKPRRGLGPTGNIENNVPLTIGGKLNCDQVKVTCDYFSGDFDYVKIEAG